MVDQQERMKENFKGRGRKAYKLWYIKIYYGKIYFKKKITSLLYFAYEANTFFITFR